MSSLHLDVDANEAAMSHDGSSGRSPRFLWTGLGLVALLLVGLSACVLVPSAAHASAKPSRLLPEVAFNPLLQALSPGSLARHRMSSSSFSWKPRSTRHKLAGLHAAVQLKQRRHVQRRAALAQGPHMSATGSVAQAQEVSATDIPELHDQFKNEDLSTLPRELERTTHQKVFSVADLHGDYDQFKLIVSRLGLAHFEGDKISWTGGNSIFVSTGDIVDRGIHSRPIYLAFQELARQAPEHGGEVVNIFGNHELMNLMGNLLYVPKEEFQKEGDYGGRDEREAEWAPDGLIGKDLRERFVAAAVRGGVLFVHGGLCARHLKPFGSGLEAIDGLNAKVHELIDHEAPKQFAWGDHDLLGQVGPFWNRFFADGDEESACEKIDKTLALVGADRMVVGHCPRVNGVETRCDGPEGPRIILADTFMSGAYNQPGSCASAIEISGINVTAIYFPEVDDAPEDCMIGQSCPGVERVPLTCGSEECDLEALLAED